MLRHTATHCNTLQQEIYMNSETLYFQGFCHIYRMDYDRTRQSFFKDATRFNTLQRAATHCNKRPIRIVKCRILRASASCTTWTMTQHDNFISKMQRTSTRYSTLQHTTYGNIQISHLKGSWHIQLTQTNILQYTAIHWTTLQHTATHCNTLQHSAINDV